MSIAGIPEVMHDFNMYNSAQKIVGMGSEVALPDLEAMTETVAGAGILGEIDVPVVGRYGSLEQEIPFRVLDEDYFKMIDPTQALELMLRGAVQYNTVTTGGTDWKGMRVVYRGKVKKITLGTAKLGGAMDSSITLELTYIYIELDGKAKFELDKINPTFKINGVDKLAKVKKLT